MPDERNLYRSTRRAFIAACEAAHIDVVARVQPGQGEDGRPLFADTAATGDRLAMVATLVIGNSVAASQQQIAMLQTPSERLVLVHALDPARFGEMPDPAWAQAVLTAVAAEDLSRVTELTAYDMTSGDLLPILQASMPKTRITSA
jgi:hypothetical protein